MAERTGPGNVPGTTRLANRPLIGGTLSVAVLTAFARLNGGVREILIARDFGTSQALEAFLVGFGLVSLLVVAISGALPGALVPTFFRTGSVDRHRASELLANLSGRLVLWLVGAAAVVAVGAPAIAAVVGGGFDAATRGRLREVIVILSPVIVIAGLSSLATSLVNARERFTLGALPQIANPIVTVAVIGTAQQPRATTLALAFLAGYTAELVVSVVVAASTGVRLRVGHPWSAPTWARGAPDPDGAEGRAADRRLFFVMFLPMVVAFAVQASSTVIDQAVASHLPQGRVAILAFGSRVPGFVAAVGITAVGTVVLPQFSRLSTAGQGGALAESLRVKVMLVALAGSAVALVLALGRDPILHLLFGRGRFTAADVTAAAQVQFIAAWQVPIHLVTVLYLKVLSAGRRQRIILSVSVAAATLNLVLDIVFAAWFGVRGIALSTTAVLAVTCVVYRQVAHADIRRLSARTGP